MLAGAMFDALIVLGCSVRHGRLSSAAVRRVERAVLAYSEHGPTRIVACGGKSWQGHREHDVFARELIARGVAAAHVLEERESLTTRGNAAGVARLLGQQPPLNLGLVTCDWHMPRALRLFRRFGLRVTPLPAQSPPVSPRRRLLRGARESVSLWLDLLRPALLVLVTTLLVACSKPAGPSTTSGAAASASAAPLPLLLEAEARRNAAGIPEDELLSESSARRVVAVRSLSRIQDEKSFGLLSKALADEDADVIAWAAFGVGQLCRGHEPEAVRALSLRAASLASDADPKRRASIASIALAIGRCPSDEAERTLRTWLRQDPTVAQAAALGLGQLARKRKRLDDVTIAALLDGGATDASGFFFFPIESLPSLGGAARSRLLEVSASALEKAGPARAFVLRALARGGADAAKPLGRIIVAAAVNDAERADAARSLIALGGEGQSELVAALENRARALIDGNAWLTSAHGVVLTLLDGLEPAATTAPILGEIAALALEGEPPAVARRKVMLRCRAAAVLAGRASASRALLACDPAPLEQRREGSLAQLEVLARGPLDQERGAAFQRLVQSKDRVVREAALELLMAHDEVPNVPELLAQALAAPEVGVAATAAKVLSRYPTRAQATKAGKPTDGSPPIDPRVVQALTQRLGDVDKQPNIELSALLLDAAAALELLGAKPALERACTSNNPTLREHAERAFARLGEPAHRCPLVVGSDTTKLPPTEARLAFETDVGSLRLTLSGRDSPLATQRLLELTRSGFYDGMLVHRVVPGFVVQLGDPDGDGFGGPPLAPLRCQTGLAPFELGSVGIALAGRDTGSSQFFVTLRRAPHLDGDYSLVGHAEPGWERLAAGDRILKARVLEAAEK